MMSLLNVRLLNVCVAIRCNMFLESSIRSLTLPLQPFLKEVGVAVVDAVSGAKFNEKPLANLVIRAEKLVQKVPWEN
jgi:hypothetical protein